MSIIVCAWCGSSNDAQMGDPGRPGPEPGDVSLCWYCLGLSVYTETEQGRKPTEEEFQEFVTDPDVIKALLAITSARTPGEAARVMGWEDRG